MLYYMYTLVLLHVCNITLYLCYSIHITHYTYITNYIPHIYTPIYRYGAYAGLLTTKNSLFTLPVGEIDPYLRKWGYLPPLEGTKASSMTVKST